MAMPDIPMYVFTGFLESGKTKFSQETLEVHIAARLTQALGRALLRAEEKVVHMKYIARQLCLQGRGQRGLSGGAAAVDGDKHARLRSRKRTDAPQKSELKISHTQHLPSRGCLIIIPQARAVKPGISSAQEAAGRHRIGIRRRRERLILRPCRSAPPRACASRAWRISHARAYARCP